MSFNFFSHKVCSTRPCSDKKTKIDVGWKPQARSFFTPPRSFWNLKWPYLEKYWLSAKKLYDENFCLGNIFQKRYVTISKFRQESPHFGDFRFFEYEMCAYSKIKVCRRTLITQPILGIRWKCDCKKSYLDVKEAGNTKNICIGWILKSLVYHYLKVAPKKGLVLEKFRNTCETPPFSKPKKKKKKRKK